MNKKALLAASLVAVMSATSCQQSTRAPITTVRTLPPVATIDAAEFYDLPEGYSPFEDPYSEPEQPLGVNLTAVQNFAAAWNLALDNAESLQLNVSNATVRAGTGMLTGGQVFEYAYPAATLFIYVLEGQVVGTRLEAHTNAWRGMDERDEWSVLWKAMVQATNGNWASSEFTRLVSSISKGFPPPGMETGTLVGEVVNDAGWVYQMVDEDLGYEYVKDVSCWVSALAGAAGRPVPETVG